MSIRSIRQSWQAIVESSGFSAEIERQLVDVINSLDHVKQADVVFEPTRIKNFWSRRCKKSESHYHIIMKFSQKIHSSRIGNAFMRLGLGAHISPARCFHAWSEYFQQVRQQFNMITHETQRQPTPPLTASPASENTPAAEIQPSNIIEDYVPSTFTSNMSLQDICTAFNITEGYVDISVSSIDDATEPAFRPKVKIIGNDTVDIQRQERTPGPGRLIDLPECVDESNLIIESLTAGTNYGDSFMYILRKNLEWCFDNLDKIKYTLDLLYRRPVEDRNSLFIQSDIPNGNESTLIIRESLVAGKNIEDSIMYILKKDFKFGFQNIEKMKFIIEFLYSRPEQDIEIIAIRQ